jgi:hypothetical protein
MADLPTGFIRGSLTKINDFLTFWTRAQKPNMQLKTPAQRPGSDASLG